MTATKLKVNVKVSLTINKKEVSEGKKKKELEIRRLTFINSFKYSFIAFDLFRLGFILMFIKFESSAKNTHGNA